ncbi:MAG: hypothetical protein J6T01_06905 [Kiritimatiellae bacterium]|nr:hypothetical protein [Kiritimatiellia bacterium]
MDEKLIIDASRLAEGGETIEGEVGVVDISEDLVKPSGGVRYRLSAEVFGNELLVRGTLEQDFALVCCRCGRDFTSTVKVEGFTVSREIGEKTPEVDLTEDVRESIILALPAYPVCAASCPGIERSEKIPADDRWNALDGLKVEKRPEKRRKKNGKS